MIGTVTGYEIKKNQDGDKNVVLLQAWIADEKDVQTIQLYSMGGDITIPQAGAKVLILPSTDNAWKKGIAIDDLIEHTGITDGEKKLYSYDGGVIKSFINFLKTGILELNGNNDFAVRFTALETGFNDLVNDYNNHVHTNPEGGNVGPAVPQTTADISGAKVDEVKII